MSVKRWIYAGFLVVASSAFIVDRFILGEPQAAAAEPVSASAAQPPAPRRRAAPVRPADKDESVDPSLSWLEALTTTSITRDLFAPLSSRGAGGRLSPLKAPDPGPTSVELFASAHTLQATYVDSNRRFAVVDGRILAVGSVFDGFRLARVGARDAEFERDQEKALLVIPAPLQVGEFTVP